MASGRRAINQLLFPALIGTLYEHTCTSNGHSSCNIQFKVQAVCLYTCPMGGGRCWYTGGQGGNLVEFHNKSQTAHSLHLTRRKENFGTGKEKYVAIMCSLRWLRLCCITQRVNKSREKKCHSVRGELNHENEVAKGETPENKWIHLLQVRMTFSMNDSELQLGLSNKQRLIRKLKWHDWPEISNLLLFQIFFFSCLFIY